MSRLTQGTSPVWRNDSSAALKQARLASLAISWRRPSPGYCCFRRSTSMVRQPSSSYGITVF